MSGEYVPTIEVIERAYVSMSTSGMPMLSRTADEERMLARMRFRKTLAAHDARIASEAAEGALRGFAKELRAHDSLEQAPFPFLIAASMDARADRLAAEREGE